MSLIVERSLFKIGESLAVTLPKAWTRDHKLKAGDQVQIDRLGINNDALVIRAKGKAPSKKFILDKLAK